jgi:hypothetical protein
VYAFGIMRAEGVVMDDQHHAMLGIRHSAIHIQFATLCARFRRKQLHLPPQPNAGLGPKHLLNAIYSAREAGQLEHDTKS